MKRGIIPAAIVAILGLTWGLWPSGRPPRVNRDRGIPSVPNSVATPVVPASPKPYEKKSPPTPVITTTIAQAYARAARFPPWSVPLTPHQWTLLHPNAYIPVSLPFSLAEGKLQIAVKLPHTTLFTDQPVKVLVRIRASSIVLNQLGATDAQVENISGKPLAAFSLHPENTVQPGLFEGSLAADPARKWPRDLRVAVAVHIGNQSIRVLAPFRYEPVQATLTKLGESYVDGAELRIPLAFKIYHAGYYRVQANLFVAATGQPVAHLTAEGELDTDGKGLELRCHASVLRSDKAPGPYRLSGFLIEHLPDRPGEPTLLGRSAAKSFPVAAHPLSAYSNTPYYSPEEKARIRFLQHFSNLPHGNY